MTVRKKLGVALFGIGLASLATGGKWPTHCQKIHPAEGVPAYQYRTNELPTPLVSAQSATGVLIEQQPAPSAPAPKFGPEILYPDPPSIRYFQLGQPLVLEADHCSIARVVLTVEKNGGYTLTLRAEQNSKETGAPGQPKSANKLEGRIKQTGHLKRNMFFVRVRGLAAAKLELKDPKTAPPPPVLFDLTAPAFMVQRGEPYLLNHAGQDVNVQKYFQAVDRIEVSFHYQ